MRYQVFAVRDSAVDAFGRPMFMQAKGQAMRSFTDEVNRADSDMAKHPADYELYFLGEFDDAGGAFTLAERPELLARAVDVFVKPGS